jgi:hypothetical protein
MKLKIFAVAIALGAAAPANAEPTRITVRAISKDAKFIGGQTGGMQVTLTDAATGEVLAKGLTTGGTGDTKRIMIAPRTRGGAISVDSAAKFAATLDLAEPRLIKATLAGPLTPAHASVEVSSSQWVVPGKHIDAGDAWLIEVPGLIVNVASPAPGAKLQGAQAIPLEASVTMMCGCILEPGGLWDANKFEIMAIVKRDGKEVARAPFTYAGKPSTFAASFEAAEKGAYEALVYAYDAQNGNTGVHRVAFTVE